MNRRVTLTTNERANAARWSAGDDAWRGYRMRGGVLDLEDRIEQARSLMLPCVGGRLLDIGCANGVISRVLARAAQVADVQGVDFVAIDSAIPVINHNLDSEDALPFPDASFDVVVCLETMEHVHNTDYLLLQIYRVLKPGGYAVISVPRLDAILNILMLIADIQPPGVDCSASRRYGALDSRARVSGHVSHFTRRALTEFVTRHGFGIEAFRQAPIYSGWLFASGDNAPLLKRLPLWLLSKVPFKQDDQLLRLRRLT